MVAKAGEHPGFHRHVPHGGHVRERRSIWQSIPLRVLASWLGMLGSHVDSAWRQKTVKNLRRQAERNALTLWFLSFMFFVTWVLQVVIYVVGH
jgi:hypothetical protein